MSTATALPAGSLIAGGMRAYFAPVDRTSTLPVPFDPVTMGRFALDTPPTGWWSAGGVLGFRRISTSTINPLWSGAPATVKTQARSAVGEELEFTFPAWSRIGMALSSGQQMLNLFVGTGSGNANASGPTATLVETLLPGSTATLLQLQVGTSVKAGDLVVVDVDYTGQTGYLGSGAAGAYVAAVPATIDLHAVRRTSFNVGRVLSVNGTLATLAAPLIAGAPTAAMKLTRLAGFADRAGGAFLQEWSGLFVLDGVQGDRLLLHYPRLQPSGSNAATENSETLASNVDRWRPAARLRALPVIDANDGTAAVCYRTYLPAPMRQV